MNNDYRCTLRLTTNYPLSPNEERRLWEAVADKLKEFEVALPAGLCISVTVDKFEYLTT